MMKPCLVTLAIMAVAVSTRATSSALPVAETPVLYTIRLNSGDDLTTDRITEEADGSLLIRLEGEPCLLPLRFYTYVSAPRPQAIAAAEALRQKKEYQAAAGEFAALAQRYRFCGWDAFCRVAQAESLQALDRRDEAIKVLTDLFADNEERGPEYRLEAVSRGRLLLARLYAGAGENKKAVDLLRRAISSAFDADALAAYNLLGDMLEDDGRRQDAILCYMRPVICFDRTVPGREYALRRLVLLLNKDGDRRAGQYEAKLKKEYPEPSAANLKSVN